MTHQLLSADIACADPVERQNVLTMRLKALKINEALGSRSGVAGDCFRLAELYLLSEELDLAEKMLEVGRKKIEGRGLSEAISLKVGDATAIPVGNETFDVVTISFGIRNVRHVAKGIEEMYRVLKPGGRVLILEFSLPWSRLVRGAYLCYLRHILPRVGAWVSGAPLAYRYLNETIETFPYGEVFCNLLRAEGFTAVEAHPLTFGVAMIYRGDKPVEPRMEGLSS